MVELQAPHLEWSVNIVLRADKPLSHEDALRASQAILSGMLAPKAIETLQGLGILPEASLESKTITGWIKL